MAGEVDSEAHWNHLIQDTRTWRRSYRSANTSFQLSVHRGSNAHPQWPLECDFIQLRLHLRKERIWTGQDHQKNHLHYSKFIPYSSLGIITFYQHHKS